jgi:hypothetical protein
MTELERFAAAICRHPELRVLEKILGEAAQAAGVARAQIFFGDGICPSGDELDELDAGWLE